MFWKQLALPFAAAALPPRLPGSCAHPHHPPLPPAEVPGRWRRRYLALPDPPALDSACCCCPPTADPGSFPKASLLPPGPSLGCLRRRRAWHSAKRRTEKDKDEHMFIVFFFSACVSVAKNKDLLKRNKKTLIGYYSIQTSACLYPQTDSVMSVFTFYSCLWIKIIKRSLYETLLLLSGRQGKKVGVIVFGCRSHSVG